MNKTMYTVRLLAGAYLVYSGYSLGKAFFTGEEDSIFMIVAAVVFVVFGAAFVVTGLKGLKKLNAEDVAVLEEAAAGGELPKQEPEESKASKEAPKTKKSIGDRARMTANLDEPEEKEE